MYLAGDIGGTKTNLALFDEGSFEPKNLQTFPSGKYPDLKSIVLEYKQKTSLDEVSMACFAIAGPVQNGVCKATNLPWVVEADALAKATGIPQVFLINDLEANAHALAILPISFYKSFKVCMGKILFLLFTQRF